MTLRPGKVERPIHSVLTPALRESFVAAMSPSKTDRGCMVLRKLHIDSYSAFHISKEHGARPAHRVSWVIANGREIRRGMCICHACDNPGCVNPDHLWEGSDDANKADAYAKGAMGPLNTRDAKWDASVSALVFLIAQRKIPFHPEFANAE